MNAARVNLLVLAALLPFAGCSDTNPPLKPDETPCPFLNQPEVTDFKGVMSETGFLYGFHLKYKADKDYVLNQLAAFPLDKSAPPDVAQGDEEPVPVGTDRALDKMMPAPREFSSLGSWTPERVRNGVSYSFFRFPWKHVLVFDPATGTVYHYISEVRP